MSVALRCQPEHIHGFRVFRPFGEKAARGRSPDFGIKSGYQAQAARFARLPKRRRGNLGNSA
jgi:hypothetical protein